MSEKNAQVFDDRDPDAMRRRLWDPRSLLRARSITPDLLNPAVFPNTTPGTSPGFHVDADKQEYENGSAQTAARSDHNHELTYVRVGEDRGQGTDDADYVSPIGAVTSNIATPFDLVHRRIVMWTFDPDYGPPPFYPVHVYGSYSVDAGVTWTDWVLVGALPPGSENLIYDADSRYVFDDVTVLDRYYVQIPGWDRTAAMKLIRTGTDGKMAVGFLPSTVPTYGTTGVGDADYTILTTDRIVRTTAALSTPRTWTLPAASAFVAGQMVSIQDAAGGVTSTNTITVARAGADTIDGGPSVVLDNAYAGVALTSDGVSKWTYVRAGIFVGGTGASTAAGARANLGVSAATPAYSDGTVPGGNTVANTVTPTAFASTYTIPASRVQVGTAIRVTARGLFGTDVVAPTLTVDLLFGATSLLSSGAVTLTAALSGTGWAFHADIVCKTAGAGGALEAQGSARFGVTSTTEQAVALTNASPVSVALNATQAVTLKVTWGTANAANTITLRTLVLEILTVP